jgi:hypothetical protein
MLAPPPSRPLESVATWPESRRLVLHPANMASCSQSSHSRDKPDCFGHRPPRDDLGRGPNQRHLAVESGVREGRAGNPKRSPHASLCRRTARTGVSMWWARPPALWVAPSVTNRPPAKGRPVLDLALAVWARGGSNPVRAGARRPTRFARGISEGERPSTSRM